jgi:hypothetical protein
MSLIAGPSRNSTSFFKLKDLEVQPCDKETGKPVDAKSNDIRGQAKYERSPQNIPLLSSFVRAVLRIKPLPDDSGNENDDELKKENVHGARRESDVRFNLY